MLLSWHMPLLATQKHAFELRVFISPADDSYAFLLLSISSWYISRLHLIDVSYAHDAFVVYKQHKIISIYFDISHFIFLFDISFSLCLYISLCSDTAFDFGLNRVRRQCKKQNSIYFQNFGPPSRYCFLVFSVTNWYIYFIIRARAGSCIHFSGHAIKYRLSFSPKLLLLS